MNTEKCKDCIYWRSAGHYGDKPYGDMMCHHLLITGRCRDRDGDKCFSYKQKRSAKK